MQSTQKEADPHDVFAIETILAARAADRAPPLAHDGHPAEPQAYAAGPQAYAAPEISVGVPATQLEPTFRAADVSDIQLENIRPDEIKIDGINALHERPTSKWVKRVVMALLGLTGAMAAAAWQHYGDRAKDHVTSMAVEWAPPFVLAALAPAEKPAAAEQPSAPAIQATAADQAALQPAAAAQLPQAAAVAGAPAESPQLQSMAQDLAAMSQQVEDLKATIAQLRASQTQMAREPAKTSESKTSESKISEGKDARASEAKPSEPNLRPRVTAAAVPPPRPAAAPARKPKPAAYPPAQAAYVPPLPPAPAQAQPAPPPPQQTLADDGEPIVRPPMPLR